MGQGYSSQISCGARDERPGSAQQKHAPEMALEIQSEGMSLWKEVIQAKYDGDSHWVSNTSRLPHGCGLWKGINLWPEFSMKSSLHVSDGNHILFWKDLWLGQLTLKEA